MDVREPSADFGKGAVVRQKSGRIEARMFFENDAVVDAVEPARGGGEVVPRAARAAKVGEAVAGFDELVFEEAEEDEAVEDALHEFGERVAVEVAVLALERLREVFAMLFEFVEKTGVERALRAAGLLRRAARFLERGDVAIVRAAFQRLAGEEPVKLGEARGVLQFAVVVFAMDAIQRGVDVRGEAAVEDVQLLKVGEQRERSLRARAVADGLPVRVAIRGEDDGRLFRLHEKTHVAVVRLEIKGVVGALLRVRHGDAALDFHLLLEGVFLPLVVHIPAERDEQRGDEILARLGLLIARREVVRLMRGEVRDEFADAGVRRLQGAFHCARLPPARMARKRALGGATPDPRRAFFPPV